MTREETATASIGIKVKIADLISQLNANNYELIMEMFENGIIDDDNDYFNEIYKTTNGCFALVQKFCYDDNAKIIPIEQKKTMLESAFKAAHSYAINRFTGKRITIPDDVLYDKYLLVPMTEVLETTRWGWNREGANCKSIPFANIASLFTATTIADITKKYELVQNWTVVFMVSQNSG